MSVVFSYAKGSQTKGFQFIWGLFKREQWGANDHGNQYKAEFAGIDLVLYLPTWKFSSQSYSSSNLETGGRMGGRKGCLNIGSLSSEGGLE